MIDQVQGVGAQAQRQTSQLHAHILSVPEHETRSGMVPDLAGRTDPLELVHSNSSTRLCGTLNWHPVTGKPKLLLLDLGITPATVHARMH